jgi:hypothetical protein
MNPDRYTVTALVHFHENTTRYPLGTAPSRRKAKRIGYLDGCRHYPLLSRVAMFELEIIDTETGERVRAAGAETEAYHRARALPTVGEVGWW